MYVYVCMYMYVCMYVCMYGVETRYEGVNEDWLCQSCDQLTIRSEMHVFLCIIGVLALS